MPPIYGFYENKSHFFDPFCFLLIAFQQSNTKSPIDLNGNAEFLATPYDFGAGVATLSGPLQPGLVYETEITDYLQFLCSQGYNTSTIKLILKKLPDNFSCHANSSDELMSNMNYPSIAVSSRTSDIMIGRAVPP